MKPFKRASLDLEQVERTKAAFLERWIAGKALEREQWPCNNVHEAEAEIQKFFEDMLRSEMIWLNDVYQVNIRRHSETMTHLSIKRIDKQPIHDWRDLQEIKNQLVGSEHEGFELYPAESRRVDTANQYHMFVLLDESNAFDFGFNGGRHVHDESVAGSVNRPLVRKGAE